MYSKKKLPLQAKVVLQAAQTITIVFKKDDFGK